MHISDEEIHKKKVELGQEPPEPTHGPKSDEGDSIVAGARSEAVEAKDADLIDGQRLDQPEGTNQRNQYRYGGERP
jgi:hypothetical protein